MNAGDPVPAPPERDATAALTAFLLALGKTLSALHLYGPDHPARERAIDQVYERLDDLVPRLAGRAVTFLDDEVFVGDRQVPDLRGWNWTPRLAAAGVQRLEFTARPSRAEFVAFIEEVRDRTSGQDISSAESRPAATGPIRWGSVEVRGEGARTGDARAAEGPSRIISAEAIGLDEEADAVRWMHGEVTRTGRLPLAEAEAVIRSLAVAMHGDRRIMVPLLQLRTFDEYTTTHAMNVSVLSMALAEHLGLGSANVRAYGVAGLMHDIGKIRIPEEILNKPGKLTAEERDIMNRHPADGARILLQREDDLDLAAVVAYEHHVMIDGGGYPHFHYARPCHEGSLIVHVCDVYDALRTRRPYRDAWPAEKVLGYIDERAGSEFHPDVARSFLEMMARWEAVEVSLAET